MRIFRGFFLRLCQPGIGLQTVEDMMQGTVACIKNDEHLTVQAPPKIGRAINSLSANK
jgi:hypothetical protein